MALLLQGKSAYEKEDNSSLPDFPLKLHGVYTKAQIQVAIGTSTLERKSPARESVERNKQSNVEAMFVDIIKNKEEGSTTNYDIRLLPRIYSNGIHRIELDQNRKRVKHISMKRKQCCCLSENKKTLLREIRAQCDMSILVE